MEHKSFKVKVMTAPHCLHTNSEDFHLSLAINRKDEKLLHLKSITYFLFI